METNKKKHTHKHLLAWRAIRISPPEARVNKYRQKESREKKKSEKQTQTP